MCWVGGGGCGQSFVTIKTQSGKPPSQVQLAGWGYTNCPESWPRRSLWGRERAVSCFHASVSSFIGGNEKCPHICSCWDVPGAHAEMRDCAEGGKPDTQGRMVRSCRRKPAAWAHPKTQEVTCAGLGPGGPCRLMANGCGASPQFFSKCHGDGCPTLGIH